MTFLWPGMFLFLLVLPLFVMLYLYLQRRRRRLADRFAGFSPGPRGLPPAGLPATGLVTARVGLRRHVPPAFFLTGLAILIVSLARPQAEVSLPKMEGIVILAFDVSGSMSATDLQPTRMEAAKAAARDFVSRLPVTVEVGVVAFSDSGFSVQKPSNNPQVILAAINRLDPQRGTSLAQGILISLKTIAQSLGQIPADEAPSPDGEPAPAATPDPEINLPEGGAGDSAVLVLLSDGENNMTPDPLEAAQIAAHYGVPVYTVGLGSPTGADIKIDGYTIHTQLEEGQLQAISQMTGGEYYNAGNEEQLQQIYANLVPKLVIKPEKIEITSFFAGASILVLLIGGLTSLTWFGRLM